MVVKAKAFLLMLIMVFLSSHAVMAQTPPADTTTPEPPIRFGPQYDYFNESLMFTRSEILKIQAALVGVENEAIQNVESEDPTQEEISAPENRYIRLGGIAYTSDNRWMIWLNGNRVTPQNLLPEIVEIKVQKDYVDLKWFDSLLRKIIRIRLKPNQAYEIRTGVLIPG